MKKIVFIRHGESEWNKENKFTGWTDVDLSSNGIKEAHEAGKVLKANNYTFDIAYTSYLKRAIETLNIVLAETDLQWIEVVKTWKLNERHYGALQGLNKADTARKYGDDQVKIWRRSYDITPPCLKDGDNRLPYYETKYKDVDKSLLPRTECLKDTVNRVVPYWIENIEPVIKSDKKVIIAAHGNSIRALIKYIDNVSDDNIVEINIPKAIPLVYELDDDLKPITHYYIGDQDRINEEIEKVKNQGKK